MLADEMGIPRQQIITFYQWLECMRQNPDEKYNPARCVDFLDDQIIWMACGGAIIDAQKRL